MCGIAGIAYTKPKRVLVTELEKQASLISHRGPDDHGVYLDKYRRVGLVSTRLAIQDLTPSGHMPLRYQDRYWIVFNGEIYNFKPLKKELEKDGFTFESSGDTEVLLKLYIKYGVSCLKKLRGMFAFCIYDQHKQTLFLARDRFGKKPLKYYYHQGQFVFASEIKAILPFIPKSVSPDFSAIYSYLLLGYIPSPHTGFSLVKKLPPGHYLTLDLISNSLKITRYYDLEFEPKNIPAAEVEDTANLMIENAVKSRLIADVPIGSFLSGGIDSSLVTAIAQKHSPYKIKTYSIGFRERQYDETSYAKLASQHIGTDHHLILFEKTHIESLPEVVDHFGEPLFDPSMLALWQLSKHAARDVKVVLTGEGGDENFAGYTRLNKFAQYLSLRKLDTFSRPHLIQLLKKAHQKLKHPVIRKLATLLTDLKYTNLDIYLSLYSAFNKDVLKELLIDSTDLESYPLLGIKDLHSLEDCQYLDLRYYLADDLFYKIDMSTMAFGLEARAPLSDHRLADYMATVPYNIKSSTTDTKLLLKKIAANYLPRSIIHRPKMGFSLPLDIWFEGSPKAYAQSLLLSPDSFVKTIIKSEFIEHMLTTHSRTTDHAPKLFSLICLELWAKRHF